MRVAPLAILLMFSACSNSRSEPKPGSHNYGLVGTTPEKYVLIVGGERPATELDAILAAEETDFWWVRIDIPRLRRDGTALDLAGGASFDLGPSAETPIRFVQNYVDTCDPSAETPTACWLIEDYVAGESGLAGTVSVRYSASGDLVVDFFVDWQGVTDRFHGPSQWHHHITEGNQAVAAASVEEIPL
jgi:hypothetical protein